ncbi:NmrA-like family domain-containing oxidoreductase phqG [Pseudocercospora fuligena]|uniref:NmrA-like family domain-containing oxidoreductase phqG n=1 Tax=Pseudocercospora fuligena TaxID=685502 RepID=A0A8H6R862_9PEZI|nr:NmrA-like family domain-containing oxidoreductase phqG [Pseudocercospora fuligena]
MASKKLLVVVGALGTQGRAITDHFLTHEGNNYTIRGLTRNADSPNAKALAAKGVEVVQADLGNVESLKKAFTGASAIFAYTDSAGISTSNEAKLLYEKGGLSELAEAGSVIEQQQGRNVADAAAEIPTLERLVWSNTYDPVEASGGQMKVVYELQAKAKVFQYMQNHPDLANKVSAVSFSIFVNSVVRFPELFGWNKTGDKSYTIRVLLKDPSSRLAWIDLQRDAGGYVSALLKEPAGVQVAAIGAYASFDVGLAKVKSKYGIEISVEQSSEEELVAHDPSGLLVQAARIMTCVESYGLAGDNADVVYAEEVTSEAWPQHHPEQH